MVVICWDRPDHEVIRSAVPEVPQVLRSIDDQAVSGSNVAVSYSWVNRSFTPVEGRSPYEGDCFTSPYEGEWVQLPRPAELLVWQYVRFFALETELGDIVREYERSWVVPERVCDYVDGLCQELGRSRYTFGGDCRYGPVWT